MVIRVIVVEILLALSRDLHTGCFCFNCLPIILKPCKLYPKLHLRALQLHLPAKCRTCFMQRWWQETAVIVVAQNAVKGSLNLVCETEVVDQENF